MIGFLVKIAILLVVGILTYNYFFGSSEEKAQSARTFGQMKDVAVSVGQLAKSEKDKFDRGKYDDALDKLGAAYKELREGAQKADAKLLKRIDDLEKRKRSLQQEIDDLQAGKGDAAERKQREEALNRDVEQLTRDSEAVLKKSPAK